MHLIFLGVAFNLINCITACPPGWYGHHCTKRCGCLNSGSCIPATGECYCPPGYRGNICQLGK